MPHHEYHKPHQSCITSDSSRNRPERTCVSPTTLAVAVLAGAGVRRNCRQAGLPRHGAGDLHPAERPPHCRRAGPDPQAGQFAVDRPGGVRLLRLLLGRKRQDRRHGTVQRARGQDDGSDASGRRAVVRTLALPLSFLLLGLGFLGIVLGDKRRALHDVIAGTAVVYSWDARAARLRFLSRG
jgi:hypothetical protein